MALTIRQAAEELGVSTKTVVRRLNDGSLMSFKVGKLTTITAIMNGKPTKLTSILHNNENYIRIRDLADAQTDDSLMVDWNSTNKTVVIESK